MRLLEDTIVRCLLLLPVWAASLSAQASLAGHIKDMKDGSPINGAIVTIDGHNAGVSGSDGRYLIGSLRNGARLAVIYQKGGYADRPESVTINGLQTVKDVSLVKDTVEIGYWQSLRIHTGREGGGDGPLGQQTYIAAWSNIDGSVLSPNAKASAAQQFSIVMKNGNTSPASLKAYGHVSTESLDEVKADFDQAIAQGKKITVTEISLPPEVAADVAAWQIKSYEKSSKSPVRLKFFDDFDSIYGHEAAVKLKDKVAVERATAASNQ